MKEKKIENDLTGGSVFKKLWSFTLPFIGANLIQTLYNMVDLYIVGRFATTADVSAVSVSGTVIATFLMLLIGLSVGATVVVGQRFGAGDKDSLSSISATGFSYENRMRKCHHFPVAPEAAFCYNAGESQHRWKNHAKSSEQKRSMKIP